MCGRYNFSKDSSSPMVQKVLENLQSRQIEVKTGDVNPGDIAAVIAISKLSSIRASFTISPGLREEPPMNFMSILVHFSQVYSLWPLSRICKFCFSGT